MAKPLTPPQIRDAKLPRALRGFDVEATERHLADAAGALGAMTRERDELRKQADDLSARAAQKPTDAETLGAVLLTAKRAADGMIATAHDEAAEIRADAEKIRAEAEGQRGELLLQARGEADAMLREAAATLESLGHKAEELRRSISAHRQEFISFLQSALDQLEGVESFRPVVAEPRELDGELLAQLPSE